jgi:hypothetical protein
MTGADVAAHPNTVVGCCARRDVGVLSRDAIEEAGGRVDVAVLLRGSIQVTGQVADRYLIGLRASPALRRPVEHPFSLPMADCFPGALSDPGRAVRGTTERRPGPGRQDKGDSTCRTT